MQCSFSSHSVSKTLSVFTQTGITFHQWASDESFSWSLWDVCSQIAASRAVHPSRLYTDCSYRGAVWKTSSPLLICTFSKFNCLACFWFPEQSRQLYGMWLQRHDFSVQYISHDVIQLQYNQTPLIKPDNGSCFLLWRICFWWRSSEGRMNQPWCLKLQWNYADIIKSNKQTSRWSRQFNTKICPCFIRVFVCHWV